MQASDRSDLYALSVNSANNDNGLWQDLCAATGTTCSTPAPTFAHRVDAGAMEVGSGSIVLIAQRIMTSRSRRHQSPGGTLLLAGTVDVYRCVIATGSSSCSLRNTTNVLNGCNVSAQVAAAQHAIALSGVTPLVFMGNDGGLWRSLDGIAETGSACSASDASHFDNLNGAIGSLAEVTGFAQHPTDSDTLLAGLGANGSAGTTSVTSAWAAKSAWPQLAAGEGGLSIDRRDAAGELVSGHRRGCEPEAVRAGRRMYRGGLCGSADD